MRLGTIPETSGERNIGSVTRICQPGKTESVRSCRALATFRTPSKSQGSCRGGSETKDGKMPKTGFEPALPIKGTRPST